MTESVAVAKEADAKKGVSPTKSDNSIHRVRNEPERQLGSLRDVIDNIRRDGGTPSVESIATELSSMHTAQRAPVLMALQQTHGNRYVQRVVTGIQAKLKVGQPGDIYEQEADRVADQVMRMPEPQVQRQSEEEEELIQTKPLAEQITPLVQRQVEEEAEEEEEEKKKEEEEILQAKETPSHVPEVTPDLESRIHSLRGGGQSLPESARSFLEPRFGYDFSNVRLHTDVRAAETARAVNAQAFTLGHDIVFGVGQYAPETTSGQRLLAHELTHVIQQGESILNRTTQEREGDGNIKYRPIGGRSSVPRIQMYRRDVHYTSTKRWTESIFGPGSREAETIAREDQGLDEGWSHPTVTSIGAFLNPSISDSDVVHFPSRARAISAVRAPIRSANTVEFGQALHRFQDSFSHSFPPPPGRGYNLDSKARHNSVFEIGLARTLSRVGAQRRYPNTRYGRGAVIRHVILGHYPDDFKINSEQRARDDAMERGSISFIRDFYASWTAVRPFRVPVPPGLRGPSLIFGPRHVGPYIRRP
ncbi:MAG: DUF4157 domain-containing protein [Halobacteriota archaeon]